MYHRNYTTYLHKELDFLKLLVTRFHEQEQINDLELVVALQKTQEIYERFLKIKLLTNTIISESQIETVTEQNLSHTPKLAVEEKTTYIEPKYEPQYEPQYEPKHELHEPQYEPLHESQYEPQFESKLEPQTEPQFEPIVIEQPQIAITAPYTEHNVGVGLAPTHASAPTHAPIIEEKKKASILAEKISPSDFQPINETLAQQKKGKNLSKKLQTAPLSSIASGIGLNDKFLYIRELFKGDSDLYNNVVKYLDTVDSLEEAVVFIQKNFDWEEKNDTAQKFVGLVYRRHVN